MMADNNVRHVDMGSGPVCAMVWEGRDAVKTGRVLLGATNPAQSAPGTIRGDFAIVSPHSTLSLTLSPFSLLLFPLSSFLLVWRFSRR